MDRTLVFVYGTLKRGFPNHGLVDGLIRSGDAAFVATARTAVRLPLVIGPIGVPFLLNLPDSPGGERVRGEILAVSPRGLARMDELEGTRRGHYERLPLAVIPGGGGAMEVEVEVEVEAEAYFADRSYAEAMWRRCGERGMSEYSENDAGEYVKPSERPAAVALLNYIETFVGFNV